MRVYKKTILFIKNHFILLIMNILTIYISISGWNYYDIRYFIAWYEEYFKTGKLLEIYSSELKVAYPPLAILLFIIPHAVATMISSNIIVWRLIDKLPLLASYNAGYFILRKHYGKLASYLWLINPVALSFIYSYQFDIIASLFILLALLSIEKKNYKLHGLFITLALLIKHAIAVIGIIPIIELIKNRNWRELLSYIGVIITTVTIFVAPFIIVDPWGFFNKVIWFHAKRPPQQLSIWAIPSYLANYDLSILPAFYNYIWIIAMAIYLLLVLRLAWRDRIEIPIDYYIKYHVLILAGFLVLSKVSNIPYFLWITPSLILLIFKLKDSDRKLTSNMVKLYLFTTVMITFFFSLLVTLAPVVAGFPVFIFEDWNWIPIDKFLVEGLGYAPYDYSYLIILSIRSIPMLREASRSIALIHHYFLVVVCIVYAIALAYFANIARKYPEIAHKTR
ncbi:MAG: glycosyltransferase family 87 protein [Desulfurococcaceae archaeon]